MQEHAFICVTESECGVPWWSKYVLRNSRLSARHLCFVQTIFRTPRCTRKVIGEPHPGFSQLMTLYMSFSYVHMGLL